MTVKCCLKMCNLCPSQVESCGLIFFFLASMGFNSPAAWILVSYYGQLNFHSISSKTFLSCNWAKKGVVLMLLKQVSTQSSKSIILECILFFSIFKHLFFSTFKHNFQHKHKQIFNIILGPAAVDRTRAYHQMLSRMRVLSRLTLSS